MRSKRESECGSGSESVGLKVGARLSVWGESGNDSDGEKLKGRGCGEGVRGWVEVGCQLLISPC